VNDPSAFPAGSISEPSEHQIQIWATDISYIPLSKGFLYLLARVDLFSRHVLSLRLSNSFDTEFCLEAQASGVKPLTWTPEFPILIRAVNSPHWPSFNDPRLRRSRSCSGHKCCFDNILVEWPWRTVKSVEVNLRVFSDGWGAEIFLTRFFWRFRQTRSHSALGGPPKMATMSRILFFPPWVNEVRDQICPIKAIHLTPGHRFHPIIPKAKGTGPLCPDAL
jgi:putative transposase